MLNHTFTSTIKPTCGEQIISCDFEFGLHIFCKYLTMNISLSFSFFMESLTGFGSRTTPVCYFVFPETPWKRKQKLRNGFHHIGL